MSDNNGWADQPGVPMNPAEPGFHWVEGCDGTATVVFWRGHGGDTHYENGDLKELDHWSGYPMWQAKEWRYLRPCSLDDLTPAEVDARIAAAHKEWLAELKHDTDALMEAARQSALAECIAACDAVIRLYRVELPEKYKFKPEGIPFEWEQTWEGWAEIAEDIAAAIRALSDTPSGMALVPREPTSAMIHAGGYALQEHAALTMDAARIAWDAMVKAAEKGEAMSDTEGLTDDQLERIYSFGVLVRQAHVEATKAMKRFPQPNYVISKIAEEAGEVVKAAIHCAEKRETAENVAKEMTQLIAMLIRLWVEGDQVHGLPPISEMGNPND